VLAEHALDTLVVPTWNPAWKIDLINGDFYLGGSSMVAAAAGYPAITVPAGEAFELPLGITFMAGAWSEPALITMAYAYEQASRARRAPRFLAPEIGV
jgi:amidase